MRHQVAHVYRTLGQLGFVPGSAGNVSVRTPSGMAITPSGVSAADIRPRAVVALTLEGVVAAGGVPSSEWPMHAAIYRAFPAAGAIVHTHADACTALACLNENLPAFHYMIAAFGGDDVRCAPYVTFGTPELASMAVTALRDRRACLLANHGMIVHAASADAALNDAVILESLARQYLLARAAGAVRVLTAAEMRAARKRFETYGAGGARAS